RVRARRLRVARSSLLLGLVRTAARLAADGRLAVMLRSRLTAGRCLARPRSRPTVALRSRWAVVLGPGLASRGWRTGARPCARSGTALSPGARSGIRLPGPRPGLGRFELCVLSGVRRQSSGDAFAGRAVDAGTVDPFAAALRRPSRPAEVRSLHRAL